MSEIDCLRIEIRRNWRGSLDYREGDLSGSVEISNTTAKDILQAIRKKRIKDIYLWEENQEILRDFKG